jgi:hypothetical protein
VQGVAHTHTLPLSCASSLSIPSLISLSPRQQVTVKWGKQSHEVEVDPAETPAVFKGQLFCLTGVPPERQKIMVRETVFFFFVSFRARSLRGAPASPLTSLFITTPPHRSRAACSKTTLTGAPSASRTALAS